MKLKFGMLFFIILFMIMELVFLVVNVSPKAIGVDHAPVAKNGQLDLREWDFEKDGSVLLNGDWQFIEGQLVQPEEFNQFKGSYNQQVPKGWDSKASIGTYKLQILLPKDMHDIGIGVRNIWSSHILFLNDQKVKQLGNPSEEKKSNQNKNVPYEYYQTISGDVVEIVIQVANYNNIDNGIMQPIDFGTEENIRKNALASFTLQWSATLLLLIFALYHITLFMMRPKNKMYLFSGLYFFDASLITLTRKERILSRVFPDISYEWLYTLQDLSTYGSYVLLFIFLIHIEPNIMRNKKAFAWIIPIVLYVMTFVVFPARTTSAIQTWVSIYANLLFLCLYIKLIYMAIKKQTTMMLNEVKALSGVIFFIFMTSVSGGLDAVRVGGMEIINHLCILGFIIMMNVLLATRMKNEAEKAEKLTVSLQNSNRIKDEFLAITSHELKTPLHGILNIVNDLIDNQSTSSNQQERLGIVKQTTEKLNYLVNDLQDFTKMRFDDLKLTKTVIDLRVMTSVVYELLASDFKHKGVAFENSVPESLCVEGDENRFRQVLFNVIHNALKFTASGKVDVSAVKIQESVHIYIEDTGCGMKKEIIPSIFDFFHSENYMHSDFNSRGMGLGLYISDQFMKKMNGMIWVEESEEGQGTTMALSMPFIESNNVSINPLNADKEMMKGEDLQVSTSQNKGDKVLIVDDNPVNVQVLQILLDEGFIPVSAYSALQALQILEEMPDIQFVVTDVMMPGMSGIELTKKIRERYTLMELPIIVTTILDHPKDLALAFEAGANDYITKPFTKETVITRLHSAQQIRHAMQNAIENEMAFLQAQIKPHFLYNALNGIIAFCYIDPERAAHLLTMLSCYLRYIFEAGKKGHVTTLFDEIEVIQAYVEIEQARFGQKLQYSYECDDSLQNQNMKIPSLFIQPLVENAIRHGLFNKNNTGYVKLAIRELEKDILEIVVCDNGVGMSENKIKKILSEQDPQAGIGLTNVNRRIRNLKGARLSIESEPNVGTTIRIVLPIERKV